MSHTQINSVPPLQAAKLPGVTFAPEALTSREKSRAHDVVRDGLIKPGGLEPLVDLLCQRGLSAGGLLGCGLVPVGDEVTTFRGGAMRYKRTVPVWILESGEFRSRQGHTHRGVTYMNTNQFVSWLQRNLPNPDRVGDSGRLATLPEEDPPQVILRRHTVPLPSVREDPVPRIAVPLPSAVASGALPTPGPPSYVSQLGDISTDNRDPLALAESDFQSVPRLDGGTRFDPDEYVIRINRLNETRLGHGLPPLQGGVTPSTYTR
jgi:hypothetical protein